MQRLSGILTDLIGQRRQFKIKFRQYDDGEHVHYPNYALPDKRVAYGDLIAWMWGNSIRIGLVASIKDNAVKVTIIGRNPKKTNQIHAALSKNQILCIFQVDI